MTVHAVLSEKTAALLAAPAGEEVIAQQKLKAIAALLGKVEGYGASDALGQASKFDVCELFRNAVRDGQMLHHVDEAAKIVEAYAKGFNAKRKRGVEPYSDASKAPFKSHLMSFADPAVHIQPIEMYDLVAKAYASIAKDDRISGSMFNAMYVTNTKIVALRESTVGALPTITLEMITAWLTKAAKDGKVKDAQARFDEAIVAVVKASKASDAKYASQCELIEKLIRHVSAGKPLAPALVQLLGSM
jgi:hypothetical protein